MATTTIQVSDQIIKAVDSMEFYSLIDGSLEATLTQLNNVNIAQSVDTVWYIGKMGVRIAGFDQNKILEVTAQNGLIDLATLSLQTGSDIDLYDGITTFLDTPYLDQIKTDDGVTAVTKFTAFSTLPGAEIEYIYKVTGSSIAGAQKFTQADAEDDEHFTYDPSTKIITLPTDAFEAGTYFIAQYKYRAIGQSITSESDKFSKDARVIINLTLQDVCTKELNHGQFIIPFAKIDGNFTISAGDAPSVHNVAINALAGVCLNQSRELFSYRIITGEAEVI